MSDKKHLGTITILVKDSCVENCTGLITVAVEGTAQEINDLTKQIDELYGIVAKASIVTD